MVEIVAPVCAPEAPRAFTRRHDATIPLAGAPQWGRLLFRVVSADSGERPLATAAVARNGFRATPLPNSELLRLDSLPAGSVSVTVLAIGFDRLRDSLVVRPGFADTVVAGLRRTCSVGAP